MNLTTAFVARYGRILGIVGVLAIAAWAINSKINDALANAERSGFERCQRQVAAAAAKAERATLEREADQREVSRATDIHWQEVQRDLQTRVDEPLLLAASILAGCASAPPVLGVPARQQEMPPPPPSLMVEPGHEDMLCKLARILEADWGCSSSGTAQSASGTDNR